MTTLQEIEASPYWLPHRIDQSGKRIQFVRYDNASLEEPGFLAIKKGRAEYVISIDDFIAMRPETGPIRFVFHTGFCRSTLLHNALTEPDQITGLNEPEILNSLARLRNCDPQVMDAVLRKLSCPRHPGVTTVVKPSNFPNRLIPLILSTRPDALAVLITNSLEDFLLAIVRKGFAGRQWGRQYYLEGSTYAGNAAGFKNHLPAMTDLQVAALGWLFMQSWFSSVLEGQNERRLKLLQSGYFDENRESSLRAAFGHLKLRVPENQVRSIVTGKVFRRDAKTGVNYQSKSKHDARRSRSAVVDDEISEVSKWISELARVSNLKVPLDQTLL